VTRVVPHAPTPPLATPAPNPISILPTTANAPLAKLTMDLHVLSILTPAPSVSTTTAVIAYRATKPAQIAQVLPPAALPAPTTPCSKDPHVAAPQVRR